MIQIADNFIYCANQATDCSFSLRGVLPECRDFIELPVSERKAEAYFSLSCSFSKSSLEVVAEKLYSFALSVSNALFCSAKRVLRRAVAGVRHFVCSNQRGMRRVAPLVPMALRL